MRDKGQFKLGFRILTTSVGVREVRVCYTRFYGPHNLCEARAREVRGVRQGVRGARQGAMGARQEVRGARQGARGARQGVRGSEAYVILGLRVPTIYDKRKFDDNRLWLGVPTTCN